MSGKAKGKTKNAPAAPTEKPNNQKNNQNQNQNKGAPQPKQPKHNVVYQRKPDELDEKYGGANKQPKQPRQKQKKVWRQKQEIPLPEPALVKKPTSSAPKPEQSSGDPLWDQLFTGGQPRQSAAAPKVPRSQPQQRTAAVSPDDPSAFPPLVTPKASGKKGTKGKKGKKAKAKSTNVHTDEQKPPALEPTTPEIPNPEQSFVPTQEAVEPLSEPNPEQPDWTDQTKPTVEPQAQAEEPPAPKDLIIPDQSSTLGSQVQSQESQDPAPSQTKSSEPSQDVALPVVAQSSEAPLASKIPEQPETLKTPDVPKSEPVSAETEADSNLANSRASFKLNDNWYQFFWVLSSTKFPAAQISGSD